MSIETEKNRLAGAKTAILNWLTQHRIVADNQDRLDALAGMLDLISVNAEETYRRQLEHFCSVVSRYSARVTRTEEGFSVVFFADLPALIIFGEEAFFSGIAPANPDGVSVALPVVTWQDVEATSGSWAQFEENFSTWSALEGFTPIRVATEE